MNYTSHIDDRLISVIDTLTSALNVCYEASLATPEERKEDYTKQYPYATGWARTSLNEAIFELDQIVRELRE